MKFKGNNIELLREKVVDFENLKTNGQRVSYNYWFPLGILHYFEMLNGRTYPDLVNHFWLRAYIYNEEDAAREETELVEKNPDLAGRSRKELGLREFTSTEIRSNIAGIEITFTIDHVARVCELKQSGIKLRE
jgi:hypothetical protein